MFDPIHLGWPVVRIEQFKTHYSINDREIERIARFKLGDPEIFACIIPKLSKSIKKYFQNKIDDRFVITGPPSGPIPSAIRIISLAAAERVNIPTIFPERKRSAAGYSLIQSFSQRQEYLRGQFQFTSSLEKLSVILVDDVVWSGAMLEALGNEVIRQGGQVVAALVLWDIRLVPFQVEKMVKLSMAEFMAFNGPKMICNPDWKKTSGLQSVLKYM